MAGIKQGEEKVHDVDIASAAGVRELAMSVAEQKGIAGCICIVLTSEGTLNVGMGVVDHEGAKSAINGIANVLKKHCDEEWLANPKLATGMFVDPEHEN